MSNEASLVATILKFQELYDSGVWDDHRLAAAVMHLDPENEAGAGEIRELRQKVAAYELQRLLSD